MNPQALTSMDTDLTSAPKTQKRSITVDPDTNVPLQESKRPKIALDANKKVRCLNAMMAGFEEILSYYFADPEKRRGTAGHNQTYNEAYFHIPVSIQISNIIFTLHAYNRQIAAGKKDTNVVLKSEKTDFTITYLGKEHTKTRAALLEIWKKITDRFELQYKYFGREDQEENWYGTFGPYIDFFCGFGLRMKELRLGHDKMPISKRDEVMLDVPVKKYGLNGAHHILLEGSTFPPEKRSSMAQSVGPMTALLCMLRSEGIYRDKWANAVKRAFYHLSIIDDIIEATKSQRKASDISTMIGLMAEIAMIATTRQATRTFFPIAMVHYAVVQESEKNQEFLEFFNTTGSGAFYAYKKSSNATWTLVGGMKEEVASQIVFHCVFGTYKEDLSILSEITNISNWYTREEMGKSFVKGEKNNVLVRVRLPQLRYYAKMSCANQSGLLTGTYSQVSTIPCFSGRRTQHFGDDFFAHIERKVTEGSTGKSISQIVSSLSITLDSLRKRVGEERGQLQMGTTDWREMASLELGVPGDVSSFAPRGKGTYFMGRSMSGK